MTSAGVTSEAAGTPLTQEESSSGLVCDGDVGTRHMFVTCHGSGGEQLQGPETSVLVGKFFLAVGVNGEVDGGEGDVTQEASFGSLNSRDREEGGVNRQL